MQENLSAFCGFNENMKTLTRVYCQAEVSGRELGDWLASVDFEALTSDLTCMAAAAGATVRFVDIPATLVPRLRGIIKYVHTLNSGMISGVCALGIACNRVQIQVLLLEDTALYMRYPDAPQRHLWQMCVGVREQQYEQILALAQEIGFTIERYNNVAVARQGITRQIVIRMVEDSSYLWNGAEELKKGNATFLCPEVAAMMIEAGQRTFRALTKTNPRVSVVRWCMDMKILLNGMSDADWIRAKAIAKSEFACCHMRLLFAVYRAVTGIRLNEEALFGTEQDAKRTLRLLQVYATCPDTGKKLRKVYLLHRLRRPDSVAATVWLLARLAFRKIKG